MAKSWKDSDTDYLKRYSKTKTLPQLAQRFGKTPAAVGAKLAELRLESKEGKPGGAGADPEVAVLEAAIEAMYAGKYKPAAAKLEQVLAASDRPELLARARQLLAACRRHLDEATPDAADPYLDAVYAKNRGDLDEALEMCKRGGRQKKDERFAFLAASIHAVAGRDEEAAEALAQAIELAPVNRVHAFHDPDFARLREGQEHAHLFGLE